MLTLETFINDYNSLDQELSGLSYNLRLDCNGNYKSSIINKNRHLIINDNGYKIIELDNCNNEEYGEIYEWINKNYKDLCLLGNEKISYSDFIKTIKRNQLIESKGLIEEMSVIQPSESGVGLKIWVDEVGQWKNVEHNSPRVKIENPKGNSNTRQWTPIILPDLKIVNQNNFEVNGKLYKKLMLFLKYNNKNIIDLSYGKITYDEFIRKMTSLDNKGNAIFKYKNDIFYQVDKMFYGYILSENIYGYFTFFNENGEIINNELIFDDAKSFINVNGEIYADVIYKGKKCKLNINGEII